MESIQYYLDTYQLFKDDKVVQTTVYVKTLSLIALDFKSCL